MGIRHDGELLGRCADEPVAFEELVARHRASLIRHANRRLGPAHADDIVNETFAVAYARRASFDHTRTDAGPWLFGIATNLIRLLDPDPRVAPTEIVALDAGGRVVGRVTPDEAALAPRVASTP